MLKVVDIYEYTAIDSQTASTVTFAKLFNVNEIIKCSHPSTIYYSIQSFFLLNALRSFSSYFFPVRVKKMCADDDMNVNINMPSN